MNTINKDELMSHRTGMLHDCLAIMESKNADYTGVTGDPLANFRTSVALGLHPVKGILLRMQDKVQRVSSFVDKGQLEVKGESVDDALQDIINYCILASAFIHEDGIVGFRPQLANLSSDGLPF